MGQVRGVLAWSPDARHWHYIAPEKSFVPLGRPAAAVAAAAAVSGNGGDGSSGSGGGGDGGGDGGGGGVEPPDFDCCGVFMAKQARATPICMQ